MAEHDHRSEDQDGVIGMPAPGATIDCLPVGVI